MATFTRDMELEKPSDGASNAGESINDNSDKINDGRTYRLELAENGTKGEAFYLDNTGKASKAKADVKATARVIGLLTEDGLAGADRFFRYNGILDKTGWGLTAHKLYYLSPTVAGGIQINQPSGSDQIVEVGETAVDTDELKVILRSPISIVSGLQNLWETISGDAGSAVANDPNDTFNILGGSNISTAIAGDTVSINLSPALTGMDSIAFNAGSKITGLVEIEGALLLDGNITIGVGHHITHGANLLEQCYLFYENGNIKYGMGIGVNTPFPVRIFAPFASSGGNRNVEIGSLSTVDGTTFVPRFRFDVVTGNFLATGYVDTAEIQPTGGALELDADVTIGTGHNLLVTDGKVAVGVALGTTTFDVYGATATVFKAKSGLTDGTAVFQFNNGNDEMVFIAYANHYIQMGDGAFTLETNGNLTLTRDLSARDVTARDLKSINAIDFDAETGDKISLYDNRLNAVNMYGFGLEAGYTYYKGDAGHRFYCHTNADGGTSDTVEINATVMTVHPKLSVAEIEPSGGALLLDCNVTIGIGHTIDGDKFKITAIGGYAIKLTNTTGAVTIQGQTVKPDTATDDAVVLTAADDSECIGVFLDSGVADDAEAWVIVSGIADVAMEDNTAATHGNWVETSDSEAGYANAESASPAAAPEHFDEIGHCIESVAAGGGGTHILARCVLHFN